MISWIMGNLCEYMSYEWTRRKGVKRPMRQSPKSSLCGGTQANVPSGHMRERAGLERLMASPEDAALELRMKGELRKLLPRS